MHRTPPAAPDTPKTLASALATHPALADIRQVEADLSALRAQLQGMERDHSALRRTMACAPRSQALAIALSGLVAAVAWALGLSVWLRYYLVPVTVLLVLVFAVGSRLIDGWMERKIHQMRLFADNASAQLAAAQQQAADNGPPTVAS